MILLFGKRPVIAPTEIHPSFGLLLGRIVLWLPKGEIATIVGQELLLDKVVGIVVAVFITIGIAKFLH